MSDLKKLFLIPRFGHDRVTRVWLEQIGTMIRSAIYSHNNGYSDLAKIELEVVDNMVDHALNKIKKF